MPRDSPWFRCFAENIMAKIEYRMMDLDERGLLFSMLLDCWPNHCVPANPTDLAKLLGMAPTKVKKALTKEVLSFFAEDGEKLFSPELRRERARFEATREKQIEGGKVGAARKSELAKQSEGQPKGQPKGQPNRPSYHLNSTDITLSDSIDILYETTDKNEWTESCQRGAQIINEAVKKAAVKKILA